MDFKKYYTKNVTFFKLPKDTRAVEYDIYFQINCVRTKVSLKQ